MLLEPLPPCYYCHGMFLFFSFFVKLLLVMWVLQVKRIQKPQPSSVLLDYYNLKIIIT